MSSLSLKMIAALSMLLDHAGRILFPEAVWLTYVGRLAFPLFVFVLVEGAVHTKNSRRYALRIGLFAVLSEIPFDIAFYGTFFWPGAQNIFLTLLIGLLCIEAGQKIKLHITDISNAALAQMAVFAAGAALSWLLRADYGWEGIAAIYIFYMFRSSKVIKSLLILLLFGIMPANQWFGASAMILIWFYNGEKGYSAKAVQWGFYLFYPVHLLLLAAAAQLQHIIFI